MDEKEFNEWVAKSIPPHRPMTQGEMFYIRAAWFASARGADSKARLECERIALKYSQAYGQIDDAMAIARDIRATIPEDQP